MEEDNIRQMCNGRQKTVHVLSACPVILNQGRLNLRHDGIVNYIASCSFSCMQMSQTPAGGTIPADVLVTADRPDIVISMTRKEKTMHVFELTVPYEHNLKKRHKDKMNRYAYMSTYITKFKPDIEAFKHLQ